MDICWYCLAMVVISTLVGALLMYLSNRSGSSKILAERDDLKTDSELTQNRLDRITTEYNDYKAKSSQRIESGEREINKLNKLNLSLSRDNKPNLTQADLDHKYIKWKKRAEDLSNELEYLKAKVESKKTGSSKGDNRKPNLTQADLDHKYVKWKKRAEDLSNELEYLKAKVKSKKGTPSKGDNNKPNLTQADLDHKYLKWKKRAEDLSSELEYIKAKVESKNDASSKSDNSKKLDNFKAQLTKALKKIRQQEIQLMEAKSNISSSVNKKKGSGKKKKKIKKLQAELLKLKGKLKNKK